MQDQAAQSRPEAAYSASYTYSFADYQASRVARRKLSPIEYAIWPWRYALLIGINVVIMLFLIWNAGLTADEVLSWTYLSEILPLYAGLIAFVALVDVLFDRVLPAWIFKRYSMANKRLDFIFRDDEIIWSSEGFKGEFAWSKITKIATLNSYLFLFISKLEAVCIPQRAFPSKDAFDHFVIYAKERANG
ncbi:YcxB family protein [Microvirga sp. ACRRW]|uniref:YcxB family protein n=1 Tax=Microvirga sp. ACRRW TaxID=2918205 RepID=UPI001EF71C9E|nr:YcxB family protein [Microvirga sp. ACRRW]MCG7392771.1 YcxB family protein [Microvirga sp. ACRRW]